MCIHVHTLHGSDDSKLHISDVVNELKSKGLGGVVITDHILNISELKVKYMNNSRTINTLFDEEDFLVFIGAEITIPDWGHFLVYGLSQIDLETEQLFSRDVVIDQIIQVQHCMEKLPELITFDVFSNLEEVQKLKKCFPSSTDAFSALISNCNQNNGLIFWAHPFDDYSILRKILNEYIEMIDSLNIDMNDFAQYLLKNYEQVYHLACKVDGYEVCNGLENELGLCNQIARLWTNHLGKIPVAGSDAHIKSQLGKFALEFSCSISSEEDFLAALKNKNGKAVRVY